MDNVVHPEMRKWISAPIDLGNCLKELRFAARIMASAAQDAAGLACLTAANKANKDMGKKNCPPSPPPSSSASPSKRSKVDPSESQTEAGAGSSSQANDSTANSGASQSQQMPKPTPVDAEKILTLTREERANMIDAMVGGDEFFNVKSKDKPKGKGRGRKSKRQKLEEQENEEAELASLGVPVEECIKGENDGDTCNSEADEMESFRAPSVKDYFSDFSNLSEDSDDSISDFDDFDMHFGYFMQHGLNDSDDDSLPGCDEYDPIFENYRPSPEKETQPESAEANAFSPFPKKEQFNAFMERVLKIKLSRESSFAEAVKAPMMEYLGISEDKFRKMQKKMNPSKVSVPGETFQEEAVVEGSVMPVLAPPLSDSAKSQLQSLAIFVTHGDDPTGFQWRSNNVQQQINDDILNMAYKERMRQQDEDYLNKKPGLVNKEDDFLIELTVYQANATEETLPDDVKVYVEPKIAYKIQILGSQTVADLRDALHCDNDVLCVNEVEHPDMYEEKPEDLSKNNYHSAMVLIHDVIYSDLRKPGGVDFAPKIQEWISTPPKKDIGPFKSGVMETTKLSDLTVQFGYPYVYIHLANCEHIFVFNKARLLEKEDEHRLEYYPRRITSSYFKNTYCRVDNEYLAKWAVFDFDQFPENPMMVCGECLKMYCYTGEGEKRGNFRLFPFRQMANEM